MVLVVNSWCNLVVSHFSSVVISIVIVFSDKTQQIDVNLSVAFFLISSPIHFEATEHCNPEGHSSLTSYMCTVKQ